MKRSEHLPFGSRSSDMRDVLRSNLAVDNRANFAYFLEQFVMEAEVGFVFVDGPFVMFEMVLFKRQETCNSGMTEF